MKILISGANGYLGSALKRDLSREFVVRGTYGRSRKEFLLPMDVTDKDQVLRTLTLEKPDLLIHCVGISGKFKQDPEYATRVNIEGTRNIVQGANEVGATLIHISSTAVFNGMNGPFNEDASPLSIDPYARTKIESERIVQSSGLRHLILRPSLIVGNAPYGMEDKFPGQVTNALLRREPLEVDNEWLFAPSYTHHISDVVKWWINNHESTNILHVVSSDITTKYDYAIKLANELGIDPSIFKDKYPDQPSGSNILDCSRLYEIGAPTISLEKIIFETANEIRNNRNPEGVYKRSKEY